MLNPAHLWQFEVFMRPDTMHVLFPRLTREVLLSDVWVRLYALEEQVGSLDPPPSVVAASMMAEVDHIRHTTRS